MSNRFQPYLQPRPILRPQFESERGRLAAAPRRIGGQSAEASRIGPRGGAEAPARGGIGGHGLLLALVVAGALSCGAAAYLLPDSAAFPPDNPGSADERLLSPEASQALFLIRSTLMALNDANRTGNYSVLRDLAGPRFQSLNSAARLADTFRGFREANLDLSRAALASSDLATTGVRERDGILVLAGRLPLQAAGGEAEHQSSSKAVPSLRFDLVFEPVAGHWRLLTLSVAVGDR